jgi:crotonobetainyl-CoA:carnitine CoA-transferase CaiB-like acyl-CoA transferase
MPRALDGVRIVDFTTTIAGPHCTRMLSDLGAEVIKIESLDGDMMRTRPPLRDGNSTSFGQLNAGKKSVRLDLKSPEGAKAAMSLLATADVLVENFRPGVMRRFALDYETVKAACPGIVYCSISGYGQTGPAAGLPAYAPVIHASSGYDLAHMSYQDDRDRPDYCGVFIADVLSGTYAFGAIMTALYHKQATGEGQHIDVSMLESMLSLTLTELQGAQFDYPKPGKPMFGPVATSDGHIMLAVASERTFQNTAKAAGRLDWLSDARFAAYLDRRSNWGEFIDEFEDWSRKLSSSQCLAALAEAGVPASAYRTVAEAMDDEQLAHRQAFTEIQDGGGTFRVLNMPFRMTASENNAHSPTAHLGEHTVQVLKALGYSEEEIARLAD